MDAKTKDKFISLVGRAEHGCWSWLGAKTGNGYGAFYCHGKTEGAHRVSYMIFTGEIPCGLCVMHSCDNPLCVNPEHLSVGTTKDNAHDRNRKLRQAYGERNFGAKLSENQVLEIIESKIGSCALAEAYGVSRSTIHRIRSRRSWAQI